MLPAALAAGNAAVVKPSEHASLSPHEFARLLEEAGFPPGLVNVVTGGAEAGQALVIHPNVAKVSFTGSPALGRRIASAAGECLKPVSLELGGKSPNIIFEAAAGALAGIFAATGQTWVAGSRLLAHRRLYDQVTTRLAERAATIRLGDPLDEASEMGTVVKQPQFDRIIGSIERARAEGARLVCGGGRAEGPGLGAGLFAQPTIFADMRNDMALAQQEIFGPALSILPFDDDDDDDDDEEDEAIEIANDVPFSLAAGVWTRDVRRAMRLVPQLKSGVVRASTYRMIAAQAPFGGVQDSGLGRERGEQGILEFTTLKNVVIDWSGAVGDPFAIKN